MRPLHTSTSAPVPVTRGPDWRAPVMIEAIAYLGGAFVLVGAMLVGAHYWPDVGTGTRLLIEATTALVLLAAGFAVPTRAGAVTLRLRAILWLLSTAAGAAFCAFAC